MNKFKWQEICRKTKYASKKQHFTKKELCELIKNTIEVEKFMTMNKGNFEGTNRKEYKHNVSA